MYKVIKIDDGYKVEKDGKHHLSLYLAKSFSVVVREVRIQMIERYPAIYGFTLLPVSNFSTVEKDNDDGTAYFPPRTSYTNVAISARETVQKYIDETDEQVGLASLSRWSGDLGAQLTIDLRKDYFEEIYELIKTRQLTSLSFDDIYFDKKQELYAEYRPSPFSSDKEPMTYRKIPPVLAASDIEVPSGVIRALRFATEPLELLQHTWGEYSVTPFGYDSNEDTYEAYEAKKNKPISAWKSSSGFEKAVVVLLVFIAFTSLIIFWSL